MPITVVCRGCHKRFQVSEVHAGKSGSCPNCKAPIYIPKPEEEVKIHTPEHSEASAKGRSGELVLKPIAREKTRLATWQIAALAGGAATVLIAAFVARWFPEDVRKLTAAVGLLLLSAPLAAGAYTFLRDAELEPYRGLTLWMRAGICGAVYAACWGFYYWSDWAKVPSADEIWRLAYIAPAFGLTGATAAFATFDLDFGTGFFHFACYVVVTLLLALTMGLAVW